MENSHHLLVLGLAVIRRLAESATYSAMVFALAPLEDSPQVKASHLECASFAGGPWGIAADSLRRGGDRTSSCVLYLGHSFADQVSLYLLAIQSAPGVSPVP